MMRRSLTCHPDTPARDVATVEVEVRRPRPDAIALAFYATPGAALALPVSMPPARADELWQHSCFELFVRNGAGGYAEFNLSPATLWAAYDFDGYRDGMRDRPMAVAPAIETERQGSAFVLEAIVPLDGLPDAPLTIGLSAVIEETDGTKSYWALRHPPGRPDFHHGDGFALQLS